MLTTPDPYVNTYVRAQRVYVGNAFYPWQACNGCRYYGPTFPTREGVQSWVRDTIAAAYAHLGN